MSLFLFPPTDPFNGQNPDKYKVLLHEAQVCSLVFANKLQKRVLFRTDQSSRYCYT